MAYVVWQDSFTTNVPHIDEQHKTLIALINRLEQIVTSPAEDDGVAAVIGELVQYTKKHFADEELHMRRINYPAYEEHKKLHEAMVKKVVEILLRLKAGEDPGAGELLLFLKNWLVNHILAEDRKFGRATVISAR